MNTEQELVVALNAHKAEIAALEQQLAEKKASLVEIAKQLHASLNLNGILSVNDSTVKEPTEGRKPAQTKKVETVEDLVKFFTDKIGIVTEGEHKGRLKIRHPEVNISKASVKKLIDEGAPFKIHDAKPAHPYVEQLEVPPEQPAKNDKTVKPEKAKK